jgi:hypothetical protein
VLLNAARRKKEGRKMEAKIEYATLDQTKMEEKSISQPIFPPVHPDNNPPTKLKPNFRTDPNWTAPGLSEKSDP